MKLLTKLATISIFFIGIFQKVQAHDIHEHSNYNFPSISLANGDHLNGIFLFEKNNHFVFQLADGTLKELNPYQLSKAELKKCQDKIKRINEFNQFKPQTKKIAVQAQSNRVYYLLFGLLFFVPYLILWRYKKLTFTSGIALFALFSAFAFNMTSNSILKGIEKSTSPLQIDSAFTPFKPHINTFWDANYFYVESHGIPTTHEMMVGISNHGWQQQVPIPQCYIGANAWPIPLNPQFSANNQPIDTLHFTRGAIAIAVNGVPIFNYHTNTGVDSYLDGQLDAFGGHCGRADDYHYHIAPLHLYNYTTADLPIAYALDGFPVFGSVEPDGTPMQALDTHHGHGWANGSYHYHGTNTAPYMINSFAGQVTEDATHQLIPQAQASPVRPPLTPLNGAVITSCILNPAQNGYTVSYTLNNQNYAVDYNWTPGGLYTFNFVSPNGTTTQTYNGFLPCEITAGLSTMVNESSLEIYPNPAMKFLNIKLPAGKINRVNEIQLLDIMGKEVFHYHGYIDQIDISKFNPAIYYIKIINQDGGYLIKTWVKS